MCGGEKYFTNLLRPLVEHIVHRRASLEAEGTFLRFLVHQIPKLYDELLHVRPSDGIQRAALRDEGVEADDVGVESVLGVPLVIHDHLLQKLRNTSSD